MHGSFLFASEHCWSASASRTWPASTARRSRVKHTGRGHAHWRHRIARTAPWTDRRSRRPTVRQPTDGAGASA